MSITIESSSLTSKSTSPNLVDQDITNLVAGYDRTLVIILAVTLPTLACIALFTSLLVCCRRRQTTIWLKKSEHSSRLQTIVINLSPTAIPPSYPEKQFCLSLPHTETIIYNRLSAPGTPVISSSFQLPIQGETNAVFDEYLLKNEQQPILRSSSTTEQPTTTLPADFPASLQAPVPIITPAFVEAIATHRLTLLADPNNLSLETSINTSNSSRYSGVSTSSYSNSSQRILLFSQRTEF